MAVAEDEVDAVNTLRGILADDGWIERPDGSWRCPYCRGLADALAMVDHLTHHPSPAESITTYVLRLERDVHDGGGSFPDALREALEEAERRCRTERGRSLVDTRPGSWEADLIGRLVAGVGYD